PATPARPAAQSPSRRAWGTARTAEDYRAGGLAMAGHRPRSRSGASGETPVPTRSAVSQQTPAVPAPNADRRGKLLQTALMLGVVVVVAAAALLGYQRFAG